MSSRDFGLIQIFSMGTCPIWNCRLWTSLMAFAVAKIPPKKTEIDDLLRENTTSSPDYA